MAICQIHVIWSVQSYEVRWKTIIIPHAQHFMKEADRDHCSLSLVLTSDCVLCTLRCLFGWKHAHARTHGERSAVSHGCELQRIPPPLLLSPPPHLASIIPVFSKQLRWQRESDIWQVTGISGIIKRPSSGRPHRLLTVGAVSCYQYVHSPFVHGAGSE